MNCPTQVLALSLAFVPLACGDRGPEIKTFSASQTTAEPGQRVSLSYEVSSASLVTLTADPGRPLLMSSSTFSGTIESESLQVTTTFTLTAENADGKQVSRSLTFLVGSGPLNILSFHTRPSAIKIGAKTALEWEVARADTIVVSDEEGNELYRGREVTGSLDIAPQRSQNYILKAQGIHGGEATATTSIIVNPLQGAQIHTFVSSPNPVNFGALSTLTWHTTDTTLGIEIRAKDLGDQSEGTTLVYASNALEGALEIRPLKTTNYTLVARNPEGNASATTIVSVNPGPPVVLNFIAAPNPIPSTQATSLSWETRGADSIQIFRGEQKIFEENPAAQKGTLAINIQQTETLTLRAENNLGATTQTVAVNVTEPATINMFSVVPRLLLGETVTASLGWDVDGARELSLLANGNPVSDFPSFVEEAARNSSGSLAVEVDQTTRFTLVAKGTANSSTESIFVVNAHAETEPNDSEDRAMDLADNPTAILAEFADVGDTDWYKIVVLSAGSSVYAETSDGSGGCNADTILTLFDSRGVELAQNDQGGIGNCARISPFTDLGAQNLAPGTYFVRVSEFDGARSSYVLNTRIDPPSCGNRINEPLANEQCDDGNMLAGDGCTPGCLFEPRLRVAGPGSRDVFNTRILTDDGRVVVEIQMNAAGYIKAETLAMTGGECGNNDFAAALRLTDNFGVPLASAFAETNFLGDLLTCARLDPVFEEGAFVRPGIYYLEITSLFAGPSLDFRVQIETKPVGCGNQVIEDSETCDDGNQDPSDACNLCAFTGVSENEVDGNDSAFDRGVQTASTASEVFSGDLSPIGDQDYYAIFVPQDHSLRAFLTVESLESCPNGDAERSQLSLFAPDGVTTLVTAMEGSPDGECARLKPENDASLVGLGEGRYFLRVAD